MIAIAERREGKHDLQNLFALIAARTAPPKP